MNKALLIARISHFLMIIALLSLWQVAHLGIIFLLTIMIVAGMLIYEHSIVSPQNLSKVNVAFFQVNWMLSIGMLTLGLLDLLISH